MHAQIWRLLLHGVVATNIRGKISALSNEQHLVYEVLQIGVWLSLSLGGCLSPCPLARICFGVATKGIWGDMDLILVTPLLTFFTTCLQNAYLRFVGVGCLSMYIQMVESL